MTDEEIGGMTLEQLQAEFVRLGNEVSVMDGIRRRIDRRLEDLRRSARAQTRLAALSEPERDALRAELERELKARP